MSKNKKTIEELLEEALVPEEEQPYEIPENWVWIKLESLQSNAPYSLVDGPFGSNLKTTDYTDKGVRLIQLQNIGDGFWKDKNRKFISEQKAAELERCITYPDNIAIAKMASPIARATLVPSVEKKYVVVADCIKFNPNQMLSKEYLVYCINSPAVRNVAEAWGKGSTRKRINLKDVKNLPIPLPPLNEQNRIAEKTERLLSKIEEARQLIEEAKETFELRREAILDKAFRGELTRKWRENKGINEGANDKYVDSFFSLPDGWNWVELSDILQMQNGMSKRRGTNGKSIPVLRLSDIKGNDFVESDLREIMLSEKEFERYGLEKDDILFIRVNGSFNLVGKAIHFNLSREAAFCDHLIRGTFEKEQINVLYIKYLFESSLIRNQLADKIVSSAGQNTVSQGSLGSLMIPLPPKEEMDAIVKVIENIISKETTIISYLDDKTQIDLLKQSILFKAFRGELGTNDPSEESAIELLKEVLQEQVK